MADILIRGMKMPENCFYCHFVSYGNDYCVVMDKDIPIYGMKPSWCPLVTLPEGHGRLIDVDKLTPDMGNYITGGSGTVGSMCTLRGYSQRQIDNAPTIVPAEGGNADGNP